MIARADRDHLSAIRATSFSALAFVLSVVAVACGSEANPSTSLSPAAERGREVAGRLGCASCHSVNGDVVVGPSWSGSWGSTVELDDGTSVVFDENYVTQAVRDPASQRRPGMWVQMPMFGTGQLSDDEVADIVAYIKELDGAP